MDFNYVDITGKGCEGWLNLFFGDICIRMVSDRKLADAIREKARNRHEKKEAK